MKLHAHPDADLSSEQLEKLVTALQEKHHELVNALDWLNQELILKVDCSISDAAEAASLKERSARAAGGRYDATRGARSLGREGHPRQLRLRRA